MERAEGLEAVFNCQYQVEEVTVAYDWFINNSLVEADTETVRARRPSFPGEPATLTILATPQHNNSVFLCRATISNGIEHVKSEVSDTATLTFHGELVFVSIVKHFTVATVITAVLSAPNTITVTWNALPLTEYCVDITRTTLDSTETVALDSVSVCGLANYEYIFTYVFNRRVCDRFSFTVTPTEGEMRGTTSEPDTGFFTRVEGGAL